jgi:hypothetical protein
MRAASDPAPARAWQTPPLIVIARPARPTRRRSRVNSQPERYRPLGPGLVIPLLS